MSKTIDQIPEDDRPREKLLRKGAPALSDQELLAVLLGKGTPGMDVTVTDARVESPLTKSAVRELGPRALGDFLNKSRVEGLYDLKLTLGPRDLSYVNDAGDRMVAAGDYLITAGGGQPGTGAPHADAHLTIEGEQKLPE